MRFLEEDEELKGISDFFDDDEDEEFDDIGSGEDSEGLEGEKENKYSKKKKRQNFEVWKKDNLNSINMAISETKHFQFILRFT